MLLSDSSANTPKTHCFAAHLQDAISLNQSRSAKYSQLTAGKSKKLSQILIWSEKITLWFFASSIDRQALPFQQAGSNIICRDFVAMDTVPPFAEHYPSGPPLPEHFIDLDFSAINRDISPLIKARNLPAIIALLKSLLLRLSHEVRYNCMARHLFESMLKIAGGIPLYPEQAQDLAWELLTMHLKGFWITNIIDNLARPLQTANTPIICQDVPHIVLP